MEDAEFRAGAIEIQWLERRLDSLIEREAAAGRRTCAAAIAAALIADRDRTRRSVRRTRPSAVAASPIASLRDAWLRAARLEALR